jgi:exonuclease VII large subunit
MSGAYLSKMFDLKCQQIKMANDMERSLSTANSIVTTLIYNLQAQCHGIIHELLDIDRAYLAELEMKLQKNAEMQLEQRSEEQSNMCKALDEKLYKVIQATKYLVNISLAIELSKNLKLPEVIEQDPTVNMNYDDLYRSEVSSQTRQLKGMYNDLHNCMERCYQMATQRIQSKSIKMQNIFEGTTIFRTAYLSDVSAV